MLYLVLNVVTKIGHGSCSINTIERKKYSIHKNEKLRYSLSMCDPHATLLPSFFAFAYSKILLPKAACQINRNQQLKNMT